ncbi:MAG: hypothetical protein KC620_24970, partial [Myxococcales bacterium]|nr:hypothetical protein [Myxococcales bacterium]
MNRLTSEQSHDLVDTFLKLGLAEPERHRLLWRGAREALRWHVPDAANPADAVWAALIFLDGREVVAGGPDHLAEYLWDAYRMVDFDRGAERIARAYHAITRARLRDADNLGLDSPMASGQTTRSHELTVALDRQQGGINVSWWQGGHRLPLGALRVSPDDFRPGADLFGALFPVPDGSQAPHGAGGVLRSMDRPASPLASAVRLRVATPDPQLAALDWSTIAFDGTTLARAHTPWTIEVTPDAAHRSTRRLPRPPRILVLAQTQPQVMRQLRGALGLFSHRYTLPALLDGVTDAGQLRHRLDAMEPHLVVLTDPPTPECLGALHDAPPVAVCAVGAGAERARELVPHVGAVVCLPDLDAAVGWLRRVALDALDPVTAAHEVTERPPRVFTAFGQWHATADDREQRPAPYLVLDRIHQRQAVKGQVDQLFNKHS